MGIGIFIKSFLPISLYLLGIGSALIAMSGRSNLALVFLTFLLPLRNFIDKIQSFPFGNQYIDIMLLGAAVGWVVNVGTQKRKFLENSFVNSIAFVLLIYMTISLFWGDIYLYGSINFNIHSTRVQDWKNFCLLPLIFLIFLNSIRNKKQINMILVAMSCSIFIECYYTALQINEHSSLISRGKISGTFQFLGPNEVAAFLNTMLIIFLSIIYFKKNSWSKLILTILVTMVLFCIAFLYSRAAYLGVVAGLVFLFWFKDKKLLLPLLLLLIFSQSLLPEKIIQRINETKSESGQFDESSQRRIDIWEQALDLFKSSPVLGIGYGVFRYQGLDLKDTHNIYIKILSEQGLVGFIIFFFLIFSFMKEGFVLYQKGNDDLAKGLGLGFFISIFVVLINNFFGDRWSYLEPNAYLWIFAALVARFNAISKEHEQLKTEIKPVPSIKNSMQKSKKKLRYYDI